MNKYVKAFLHRGLIFGGFGPLILGIVLGILGATLEDFSLSGTEVLLGVVSTYILAFVHAGASVFNQIESWPIAKSMLFHFLSLYVAYLACYVANSWIPFELTVILIFTAIFVATYFIIWGIVVLAVKATEKKLNRNLRGRF